MAFLIAAAFAAGNAEAPDPRLLPKELIELVPGFRRS